MREVRRESKVRRFSASRRVECPFVLAPDACGEMNGCGVPQRSDAGSEAALSEGAHRITPRRRDDVGHGRDGSQAIVTVVLGPDRTVVREEGVRDGQDGICKGRRDVRRRVEECRGVSSEGG